jgi:fatty acid-binding protein DegV
MSQSPKRKKPRLKRLNITAREKWEKILKGIEKTQVPVTVLESITVNLIDGTQVSVDIKELIAEGNDPDDIEAMLNEKLTELDHIIKDVDFYVSIDDVAKVVQPITDGFLKDL